MNALYSVSCRCIFFKTKLYFSFFFFIKKIVRNIISPNHWTTSNNFFMEVYGLPNSLDFEEKKSWKTGFIPSWNIAYILGGNGKVIKAMSRLILYSREEITLHNKSNHYLSFKKRNKFWVKRIGDSKIFVLLKKMKNWHENLKFSL